MNAMWISIGVVVLGIVACLGMTQRFLWRVYDRGGAKDVHAAAKALREVYDPRWVLTRLVQPTHAPTHRPVNRCQED